MTVDDIFSQAVADIFDVLGDTITYNGVEIKAEVVKGTEVEKQAGLIFSDAQIDVLKSDVPTPSASDAIVIDSVNYRFGKILSEDSQTWTLAVNKTSY